MIHFLSNLKYFSEQSTSFRKLFLSREPFTQSSQSSSFIEIDQLPFKFISFLCISPSASSLLLFPGFLSFCLFPRYSNLFLFKLNVYSFILFYIFTFFLTSSTIDPSLPNSNKFSGLSRDGI